jgi:hypothetical protein
MSTNPLRYDRLIEEALRGVVRRALREVADVGDLPGSHHFYITFKTTAAGVSLADRRREKYPDEMTIVLQYQFWALEVAADHFAVTLKFDNVPERLVIPFAAVTAFADPAAKFGLQFQQETGAAPDEVATVATPAIHTIGSAPAEAAAPADALEPPPDTKIVTLDNFRRK